MTTSLSWIKAYVPELEVEPQEYMDAMTLSGSKVEGYKKLDEDLEKIVIGQVLKVEKHPGCRQTGDLPGRYRRRDHTDRNRCTKRI